MARDALKTLFYPFENGTLAPPAADAKVLFLGAEAGFKRPEGFEAGIASVQPLRSLYRALEAARVDVTPVVEGEDYAASLILLGKHKGENENRLAEALKRTEVGGLIVVAGAKEDGIQPLRKRLLQMNIPADSMPKYHAIVLWFARPEDISELLAAFEGKSVVVDDRFEAAPGMFSHDRVDAGSELLASRFPTDFAGHAADFGAGWGYLSVMLAKTAPGAKGIDLFEAHHDALEAARRNMAENAPKMPARFYWSDLTAEAPRDHYDLIVMNPPFHEGHAAEPSLGVAMIRMAAKSLKQGGRLMLVANRGLTYETAMPELFKEWGETCRNARFKVLWGKR